MVLNFLNNKKFIYILIAISYDYDIYIYHMIMIYIYTKKIYYIIYIYKKIMSFHKTTQKKNNIMLQLDFDWMMMDSNIANRNVPK